MAQVTIYLDRELEEQVRAAAVAAGRSLSAHIADVLRGLPQPERSPAAMSPEEFWEAVGVIEDFPLIEEIRAVDRPASDRVDL